MRSNCRSLSPVYEPVGSMPCSSDITSQNYSMSVKHTYQPHSRPNHSTVAAVRYHTKRNQQNMDQWLFLFTSLRSRLTQRPHIIRALDQLCNLPTSKLNDGDAPQRPICSSFNTTIYDLPHKKERTVKYNNSKTTWQVQCLITARAIGRVDSWGHLRSFEWQVAAVTFVRLVAVSLDHSIRESE